MKRPNNFNCSAIEVILNALGFAIGAVYFGTAFLLLTEILK